MTTSNRTKLLLDIGTFAAFLMAMDPRSSGIAVHEWLTLALAATIIVHLLFNWNWIAEVTKRQFFQGAERLAGQLHPVGMVKTLVIVSIISAIYFNGSKLFKKMKPVPAKAG